MSIYSSEKWNPLMTLVGLLILFLLFIVHFIIVDRYIGTKSKVFIFELTRITRKQGDDQIQSYWLCGGCCCCCVSKNATMTYCGEKIFGS